MRPRGWILASVYVGVVATLTSSAFWRPNRTFSWNREGVAMLVTLPALILALPFIYVVGAAIWNITNADGGGPMWPVTVVCVLMFAGVAVANVGLLDKAIKHVKRSRLTAKQVL